MRRLVAAVAVLAAVAGGACSSNNKVGSGVDLNVKNAAGQGAIRNTTTTAAPSTTVPQQSGALGKTTTTPPTVAPTTAPPTTAPQVATLDIAVNGDSSGVSQFDPSQARVYTGSLVKWTNNDSQPRSIEADDGTFSSGPLAPGQSFSYKADKAGRFNYHDGTRPYAVASLEVLAR